VVYSVFSGRKAISTTELSTQLKKQREVKKKWKRHRSPKNYQEYHEDDEVVQETEQMVVAAKQAWWLTEIGKLDKASQADKWKIINKLTNYNSSIGVQPI